MMAATPGKRGQEFILCNANLNGARVAERGVVDGEFDAEMLFLALLSLIMLPAMLPQIVFLASGLESDSPEFSQRLSSSSNICQSTSRIQPLTGNLTSTGLFDRLK